MASRARVSDDELLSAARRVFLRDGVDAPTSAVASEAGVSEALVFKRFHTREAMLHRALAPRTPRWHRLLDPAPADARVALEQVALAMVEEMRAEMPASMLAWSRSPGDPWAGHPGEPPPVIGIRVLSAWFDQLMRAERLRPSDPELLARVFSGAVAAHAMAQMTGLATHLPLANSAFARGLVESLWVGVEPR
jgi:AcrR family transcriptional regulator